MDTRFLDFKCRFVPRFVPRFGLWYPLQYFVFWSCNNYFSRQGKAEGGHSGPATLALPLVLRLGVGNRLPLHVARCISTMAIGTMWSMP